MPSPRKRILDWGLSSLTYLNGTQFLGAFNDNFYRGLTGFMLLDLAPVEAKGRVLAIAGAAFLIPFLLFSSSAGRLADRYSKSRIIVIAKLAEIAIMVCGALALWSRSFVGALVILGAMAAQSAFFGPSKFGIVPEIVPRGAIAGANGWIALFTNIAIVSGLGVAAKFCTLTDRNFALGGVCCIVIAILGTLFSLGIEYTRPRNGQKALHWRFWRDIWRNWQTAGKFGHLQAVLLAYFAGYYIAGYMQANMIPYAVYAMNKKDTAGNYLFSYTGVGIGIGAVIAGYVNRHKLRMHHVPLAFFFTSLGLTGLALFPKNFLMVLLSLQIAGVCMGFFVVPAETYLQTTAPDQDRGEMLSTSSFLSFFGALVANGTLFLLEGFFDLSPDQGFGLFALFALIASAFLWRAFIPNKGSNALNA